MIKKLKIGCYGASLDPITNGHIEIIRESLKIVDKLIVGVGTNPDKINKYMFSHEERVVIAKEALKEFGNKVEVHSFENELLIDFAKSHNCNLLIRGLRDIKDFQEELVLKNINQEIDPDITTIFLTADKKHTEVSSSLIKGLLNSKNFEKIVKKKVPNVTYQYLLSIQVERMVKSLFKTVHNARLKDSLVNYLSEKRFYHNMEHVYNILKEVDLLELTINEKKKLYLIAIYHDVIYNPKKTDNEEQSAKYFLKNNFTDDLIEEDLYFIEKVIVSTLKHLPFEFKSKKDSELNKLFLDLDLFILSSDQYEDYSNSIRKEYHFVPILIYNKLRSKILNKFIKRKNLYFTKRYQKYNKLAIENLKKEIKQLKK